MLKTLMAVMVLALVCSPFTVLHSAENMNSKEIVKLINGYRRSQGLKLLKENTRLKESSRLKADEMAKLRYFSHTSPAGDSFVMNIKKVRYQYGQVGEILARGCRNERQALQVWRDSPPHRETMLNPAFVDIGCSNRTSSEDSYVVCHFGRTLALR